MMVYCMPLRHWFLPNKKNNFHPIALRPTGLAIFLGLIVISQVSYNLFSAQQLQVLGYAIDVNTADISALSNQQRAAAGLPALNLSTQLNSAAQAKATDMFAKNYWAHVAPNGKTPWAFILESGYSYQTAGENLAKDFNTSGGVVSGWMGSPEHKANILNSGYQDVGYAVMNGTLLGSETTLVVAMYGSRPAAPVAATTAPAATPVAPVAAPPATVVTEPQVSEVPAPSTVQPEATPEAIAQTPGAPVIPATSPTTTNVKGDVKGAEAPLPLKVYVSLNWGQKAAIVLTSTLALLFIMKHTLVWRQQKRGYRHIWLRAHPLSQAVALSAILVVTIMSSVGAVL